MKWTDLTPNRTLWKGTKILLTDNRSKNSSIASLVMLAWLLWIFHLWRPEGLPKVDVPLSKDTRDAKIFSAVKDLVVPGCLRSKFDVPSFLVDQCLGSPIQFHIVKCKPQFVVASKDPIDAKGFAWGVQETGCWDDRVHDYLVKELSSVCKSSNPNQRRLIVDVGAHFGFFTGLGAALGCKVIAIEANPLNIQPLILTTFVNGFHDRVDIRHAAVSERQVEKLTFKYGSANSMGGHISGSWNSGDSEYNEIEVPVIRLDELIVEQDIELLKIDTEGNEPSVIESAKRLIARKMVKRILMEWNPQYMQVERGVKLLNFLTVNGYTIRTADDMEILSPVNFKSFTQLLYDFKHPKYVHYTDLIAEY